MKPIHQPVLLAEVLQELDLRPGAVVIDGTVGFAGHAVALWAAVAPGGRLLGIDRDPDALASARQRLPAEVELRHGNFRDVPDIAGEAGFVPADALLVDLGVSSAQIDRAERGFSFRGDGPLDMRMDPSQPLTAAEIVNDWDEAELERIIRQYGEERRARRVAQRIVAHRPIHSTGELRAIVAAAVAAGKGPSHPARRTFQALRIAVNDELGALAALLDAAPRVVRPGGRVAVISFHSLEDRIVKRRFHEPPYRQTTKKPLQASTAEEERNPRARSAKLRVAIVLSRAEEA
jgi:16S rRNA (cytosine1402-N4)-methyltransferase